MPESQFLLIQSTLMNWHLAYTLNWHEKCVAQRLQALGMDAYVPVLKVPRRWKNRVSRIIDVPLFPNYVFIGISGGADNRRDRIRVLSDAGVRFLIPGDDGPAIVDPQQLDTIRLCVEHYRVAPHARLIAGRIGNVVRGPLSGKSGLIPTDGTAPLVFNIDILGQGLAVFLADDEVSISDEFAGRPAE